MISILVLNYEFIRHQNIPGCFMLRQFYYNGSCWNLFFLSSLQFWVRLWNVAFLNWSSWKIHVFSKAWFWDLLVCKCLHWRAGEAKMALCACMCMYSECKHYTDRCTSNFHLANFELLQSSKKRKRGHNTLSRCEHLSYAHNLSCSDLLVGSARV